MTKEEKIEAPIKDPIKDLNTSLMLLYEDLIQSVKERVQETVQKVRDQKVKDQKLEEYNHLACFCAQWGEHFLDKDCESPKIMFVGYCTNGWKTTSKKIDTLFGDPNEKETIFNRNDQMKWVEDEGYVNKSPFWCLIRDVSQQALSKDKELWYNYVAWSNLFKMAPQKERKLKTEHEEAQFEVCKQILKTEIEKLEPKFVVFIVAKKKKAETEEFLKVLTHGQEFKQEEVVYNICDKKEQIFIYRMKEQTFIYLTPPHRNKGKEDFEKKIQRLKTIIG